MSDYIKMEMDTVKRLLSKIDSLESENKRLNKKLNSKINIESEEPDWWLLVPMWLVSLLIVGFAAYNC